MKSLKVPRTLLIKWKAVLRQPRLKQQHIRPSERHICSYSSNQLNSWKCIHSVLTQNTKTKGIYSTLMSTYQFNKYLLNIVLRVSIAQVFCNLKHITCTWILNFSRLVTSLYMYSVKCALCRKRHCAVEYRRALDQIGLGVNPTASNSPFFNLPLIELEADQVLTVSKINVMLQPWGWYRTIVWSVSLCKCPSSE